MFKVRTLTCVRFEYGEEKDVYGTENGNLKRLHKDLDGLSSAVSSQQRRRVSRGYSKDREYSQERDYPKEYPGTREYSEDREYLPDKEYTPEREYGREQENRALRDHRGYRLDRGLNDDRGLEEREERSSVVSRDIMYQSKPILGTFTKVPEIPELPELPEPQHRRALYDPRNFSFRLKDRESVVVEQSERRCSWRQACCSSLYLGLVAIILALIVVLLSTSPHHYR